MPPRHATGDHRAIHAPAELLHAREQGAATDHRRQGLDQADVGVVLHAGHQAHDAVAGHQAVGIQDQHLRVGAAEATHPVGDVAGLAPGVVTAAAVEQAGLAVRHPVAQFGEHLFLGSGDVVAAGIAEHEEIEAVELAGGRHRLIDRLQAGQQAARIFVVRRHQQCGTAVHGRQRFVRVDAEAIAAVEHRGQEAGQRAGKGQRDPGEQADEQHQQAGFEHADAIGRQHPPHHPRGHGGHPERATEDVQPTQADQAWRGAVPPDLQCALAQGLLGHRQWRFRGQQRPTGITPGRFCSRLDGLHPIDTYSAPSARPSRPGCMHQGSRRAFPAPALVLAVGPGPHSRCLSLPEPTRSPTGGIENAVQSRAPNVSRVRRPTPGFLPIQLIAGDHVAGRPDVTPSAPALDRNK